MKKVQIISILFTCTIVILVLIYNGHNQQNNKITETNKSSDIKIKRLASNVNDDWALEALGWRKAIGERSNTNIKVAIIDSGIDKNIKDVNIKQKKSFINTENELESNEHGTELYKILRKMAPYIIIIPITIYSDEIEAEHETMNSAIEYAINHNVDIINISMACSESDEDVIKSIEKAINNNITVICSSGNTSENIGFPANQKNTISCMARDINNVDVLFSNRDNSKRSFSLPGVHVLVENNTYKSGSSYSSIYMTGCISIIKSIDPKIDNKTLISLLKRFSVDSNEFSYGLVNLSKLVNYLDHNETFQ